MLHQPILTDRQQRELDYHRDHAAQRQGVALELVPVDCVTSTKRRPWNAFWSMYDRILAADLAGKRVLVPGCGFGDDAIRIATLGAKVSAFDLSPELIEIAEARAAAAGLNIDFGVMPAETMTYADGSFDAVVFVDILHHVDIAATMAEIVRVAKPGAIVIGDELYTHSAVQRVRESWLVEKLFYRAMRGWIYGKGVPYITEDEHKIDEAEYGIVLDRMATCDTAYYNMLLGRLFPVEMDAAAKTDRVLLNMLGGVGAKLAGRIVFSGTLSPQ